MLEDKCVSAIGKLYDAALQPEGWGRALKQLTHALDSDTGGIVAQDRTSGVARAWRFRGIDRSAIAAYETYYGPISPTFQDSMARPTGSVYTDDMYPDHASYVGSEIYNDYFKPNGMAHMVQTQLPADHNSVVTVIFRRGKGRSFYGEKVKRRFTILEPHIRRTHMLTERMAAAEANRHAGLVALDAVNGGVVLVDGSGRLCFANAAAEKILARCDGLAVRQGRLCVENGEERQKLRHLVSAAASFGRRPDVQPGGDMAVSRPSGKRSLFLSITPVGTQGLPDAPGRADAIVTITDPEERPALPCEMLRSLFGLTPAEARLAAEMATGDSLEHLAERLGVTRESARTTLKRVYDKTDTHRQAELVRLLLSVPRRR